MLHATLEDLEEVYALFLKEKKYVGHVRKDYILRTIEEGRCVYQDGVIITYKRYKRKQPMGYSPRVTDLIAMPDDHVLNQIVTANKGNGAAQRVAAKFLEWAASPTWTKVRSENERSINFMLRLGFNLVGTTSWSNGSIPGVVMLSVPR